MKVYTKTGDKGKTSLFGGDRVPKYNNRIEAYGTVDELNSHIGLVRDQEVGEKTKENLIQIQNDLFTLGAMLATPKSKEKLKNNQNRLKIPLITNESIVFLEKWIDQIDKKLPPMTNFVLPGGHPIVSYCHIARCVSRRAERLVVKLSDTEDINEFILQYLNRLSDLLFVLARKLTFDMQAIEIPWKPKM